MKPLKILSISFLTGFSGAIMPGSLLAITITSVIQLGFMAAIFLMIGHSLLELILVIALTLGLKNVLQNKYVTGTVGVVGGMVLLWFAYGMLTSAYSGISAPQATAANVQQAGLTGPGLVVKGAITSLSNPYWLIWWATIGVTYMMVSLEKKAVGITTFYIGHISSDFVWYSAVALALVLGKQLLSDKIYMGLIIVCGLFLVYLGIYFFYTGIRKFMQNSQKPAAVQESAE
ncbi:lysine transporter LysE [Candidatus Poribacteria bacterium]|nr:lysine transporter LysE [Candidatus Poribacteria bacterium]